MIDGKLSAWAQRHGVTAQALAELALVFDGAEHGISDATPGSEQRLQSELRIEASRRGCALWRNNTGVAIDKTGRAIRYGLANDSARINAVFKSSDLIGITPIHHAGLTFGVFTAFECKRIGFKGPSTDHEQAQNNYLMKVAALGGIARFVTRKEDAYGA